MKNLKLRVGQAHDKTWYWHRKVNGRITAHGADYNSKAGAVRGLVEDMITTDKLVCWLIGTDPVEGALANQLRRDIRKHIEVVP